MLQTLKIKNFALIKDQTIEFKDGFNVLVGETGAGKSLILDALAFVMGDKSNKLNIRHDEQKMSVQAVFDCSQSVNTFLQTNDIELCDSLILSRSLSVDGKGSASINGTIVPASMLKQLSSLLVDTYAQNENIELLKVKNHINILDSYAASKIDLHKQQIADLLRAINNINNQIEHLGGTGANREREIELLDYQIKDIESANLKIGEDNNLKQEIEKLANYEKIYENLQLTSNNLLHIDELLSQCEHCLTLACRYDESLEGLHGRIASAKIELKDINESLSFGDNSFSQAQLDALNNRYEDIKLLKKKYGFTIEDVLKYLEKIKQDYDDLLFGEEKLIKLQASKKEIEKQLYKVCVDLSNVRRQVSREIEGQVICELSYLGFKNCKFKISFKDLPSLENACFTYNGLDDIEFLFSANAGEELKSLSKTISGGEMSRFMLAIKNVFAGAFLTSTLVFDEVDTGISGETGQKVAERMAMISRKYQLICITHLCQVSAMADNYIYVKKEVENNKTYTRVKELDDKEIIDYIAVVSGAEPTEVAIKFAKELKEKANSFKSSIS